MQFTQIRNATAILTYGGKRILIDPMFAECFALPGLPLAADPTRRNPTVPLPCPAEALLRVDAALVTHLHFDHFDEAAARLLPKTLPLFAGDATDAEALRALGFADVRALPGEGTLGWEGLRIRRAPALHGQGPWMADLYARLGVRYAACGALFQASGEPTFYLAGDTVWFPGVEATLRAFVTMGMGRGPPSGRPISLPQGAIRPRLPLLPPWQEERAAGGRRSCASGQAPVS